MMALPKSLPVAALTVEQFEQLMADALASARAMAEAEPPGPVLLDREGLARALGCSTGTVDKLRKQGLPERRLGDSPRFVLAEVLAWLPSTPRQSGAPAPGAGRTARSGTSEPRRHPQNQLKQENNTHDL